MLLEIEQLHQLAVSQGLTTYHDPQTGFTVFTELAHLKRGTCCGNQCRHCPYGWEKVADKEEMSEKQQPPISIAKVSSGDACGIQKLLQQMKVSSSTSINAAPLAPPLPTSTTPSSSSSTTISSHRNVTTTAIPTTTKSKTGGHHGGRLTDKNVPYTRGGDQGTAQLLTGERRSKHDVAFDAMGTVDELCAVVGVAHAAYMQSANNNNNNSNNLEQPTAIITMNEWLLEIMSRLFDIGSYVAKPRKQSATNDSTPTFTPDGVGGGFHEQHTQELEDWIDLLTEALPELQSFILPTGCLTSAHFHVARTVCRRAERTVVPLIVGDNDSSSLLRPVCDPNVLKYLNRLSDFLFAAARWVNYQEQVGEVLYQRPTRGAKQRQRVVVKVENETTGGE